MDHPLPAWQLRSNFNFPQQKGKSLVVKDPVTRYFRFTAAGGDPELPLAHQQRRESQNWLHKTE
jgi:hypothetical protein